MLSFAFGETCGLAGTPQLYDCKGDTRVDILQSCLRLLYEAAPSLTMTSPLQNRTGKMASDLHAQTSPLE